jgi:hypothetical protein
MRLGKGHVTAGVSPWAARGADAEAGRRAARGRAQRRGVAAFGPKRVADPLFKIEKLQNFV